MRPIFAKARERQKRVVLCNGEEERVLYAMHDCVLARICRPILVGRKQIIESKLQALRIKMKEGEHFEVFDNDNDPRYENYCEAYYQLRKRKGVTRSMAKKKLLNAPNNRQIRHPETFKLLCQQLFGIIQQSGSDESFARCNRISRLWDVLCSFYLWNSGYS